NLAVEKQPGMDSTLKEIVARVVKVEGGYVNDPDDPGGATMFGITEQVARVNGYKGAMHLMPLSFAEEVYLKRYVMDPRFHDVVAISPRIGEEVIDTGVNMGPAQAAMYLQRALNAMNYGMGYGDLFADGR